MNIFPNFANAIRTGMCRAGILASSMMIWSCANIQTQEKAELLVWPRPPELPRYVHETTIYSNLNVTVLPDDVKFRMTLTGQQLPDIRMEKPYGVAVRLGKMYVTDTAVSVVHVFDFARKRYFKLGYRFEGKLVKPLGITTDSDAFVYVADASRKSIIVYDAIGLYQRVIGGKKELTQPTAVAVNAELDRVYVLDAGGIDSNDHRVVVFNRAGEHLFNFGQRGHGPTDLNLPADIAIAPNGDVLVLDSGNFRIQRFDATGRHLSSWGGVGTAYGNFARPRSISVDDSFLVYVTDAQFGNVQVFNQNGDLMLFMGSNELTDSAMKFSLIAGVAADETNRIFLVDQRFKKVEILRKLTEQQAGKLRDQLQTNR